MRDGISYTQTSTWPQVTMPRPGTAFCSNRSCYCRAMNPDMALSGSMGQDLTTPLGSIVSYSDQVFLTTLTSPVLPLFIHPFPPLSSISPPLLAYLSGTRASVCLSLIQECYVILLPCVTEQEPSQAWSACPSCMSLGWRLSPSWSTCPGRIVPGNLQY